MINVTETTGKEGKRHMVRLSRQPSDWRARVIGAIYAVVLVMSGLFLMSVHAHAATVTIDPDNVTTAGGWSGVTAANLSDSDDGTYATITGTTSTFTVRIGNSALYSGNNINSITIWVRANVLNGSGGPERLDFGPTGALSGAPIALPDDPTISDFSYAPAGPWTDTDVDNLEVDVATDAIGGGEEARVYKVWVVVDYSVPDTNPPTFGGLTSATDAASGGTVDLTWNAASDPEGSTPITYKIYWATTSGGQNFSTPGSTSSLSTGDSVSGLTNGQIYYFVVRAEDSLGNEDSNTTELSATPTSGASCTRYAPTVSLGTDKSVAPADSVVYTVSITNADTALCSASTFSIAINPAETNGVDFNIPSVLGSSTTGSLAPGAVYNTSLTVTAYDVPPATEGNTLSTWVEATDSTDHGSLPGSGSVITTIAVPKLLHNSDTTISTKWNSAGGWGIAGGMYGAFTCETCHTQGTSNIKSIKGTITAPNSPSDDFPGSTVVFTDAREGTSDFGDDTSAHSNSQKICEVCHTYDASRTNGVKWHAYDMSAGGADLTHNNNSDCTTCHKHNQGFKGKGDACDACHLNPPDTGAHLVHTTVTVNDLTEDRTDCANCHTGADTYTYSPGGLHQNQSTDVDGAGFVSADNTCSSACHTSSVSDGFWSDTALDCTACHGQPPATGKHSSHVPGPAVCSDCHSVPGAGDTAHITDRTGANEGLVYSGMAAAAADEAEVIVATWDDGANTCSIAACHNPSNDGHMADWDTDTSSCNLCHNYDVASTEPMITAGHDSHITNSSVIGVEYACGDCHADPGSNNAHRNGTLDTLAGVSYLGDNYGGGSYGTCTTASCHSNGVTQQDSPSWEVDQANDCTVCHAQPPSTGDHSGHWVSARQSLGLGCLSCHNSTAASDSTIVSGGGLHINGSTYNVAAGGNYDSSPVTITYNQGSPSTCTASCHASNPKNWAPATSCDGCHLNPPDTGAHLVHTTVTVNDLTEDRTDCANCHTGADTYTYSPGGLHQNSATDVDAAGFVSADNTCSLACHNSSTGDGFWTDTALDCTACHGQPPATGKHSIHIAGPAVCSDCHSVPGAGDTAHITDRTGANEGLVYSGMAAAAADEAEVIVATWDDGANTCSNTACHNPSNDGHMADWDTDTASCTLCHNSPPGTGSHTNHWASTYVTACTDCHPNNTANDHLNGLPVDTTTGYSTSNGTCASASCHGNTAGADWRDANPAPACYDCHITGGSIGTTPSSGLHAMTNATDHDNTISGGCEACHTSTPTNPDGDHKDGVTDTPATATFNFSSTNKTINLGTLSDNTDDTCAASCHSDSNNWYRLWSADADLTDTTPGSNRCNVCHGQLNNWRSGMSVNHNVANINANNHSQCETCHVAPNSPYSWATHHEDGTMQYNSNSALNYSTTAGTCNSACHDNTSPYNALNPSSIFTGTQGLNGTGVSCTSCHGYPPTTDGGANDKHVAGATAVDHRKGGSTTGITSNHDECVTCHGTKDDGSGGFANHANYSNHKNNNITMNGPNSPLTGAGYDDANFGCDAACHANSASYQLSDSGLPVDYGDFGAGGSCTSCHTSGGGIGVTQLEVYPGEFDPSSHQYGAHRIDDGSGNRTAQYPSTAAHSDVIASDADVFVRNSSFPSGVNKNSVLLCEDCHDTSNLGSDSAGHMGSVDRSLTDGEFLLRTLETTITQSGAGASISGYSSYSETKNFCLNCHRLDVYIKDSANTSMSAFVHVANGNCDNPSTIITGIHCQGCHAAGVWSDGAHGNGSSTFPLTINNTGFMNGGSWNQATAIPTSGNCYTTSSGATSWSSCGRNPHN